jgi:uncharacterized lipoprotein YmbA
MSHVKTRVARSVAVILTALLTTSCASPPLSLYTLQPSYVPTAATPFSHPGAVIEIRRVVLPDYLDTQDILVRNGNTLQRSPHGRWASRLSIEVTRYLTALLAARRPNALVTDQPPVATPNDRILITISNLDVTTAGRATLQANWTIVPHNSAQPVRGQRALFAVNGPVSTDQDVVVLTQALLTRLADAIDIAHLR